VPWYLQLAHSNLSLRAFTLALLIQFIAGRTVRLGDDYAQVMPVFEKRVAVELHAARF